MKFIFSALMAGFLVVAATTTDNVEARSHRSSVQGKGTECTLKCGGTPGLGCSPTYTARMFQCYNRCMEYEACPVPKTSSQPRKRGS